MTGPRTPRRGGSLPHGLVYGNSILRKCSGPYPSCTVLHPRLFYSTPCCRSSMEPSSERAPFPDLLSRPCDKASEALRKPKILRLPPAQLCIAIVAFGDWHRSDSHCCPSLAPSNSGLSNRVYGIFARKVLASCQHLGASSRAWRATEYSRISATFCTPPCSTTRDSRLFGIQLEGTKECTRAGDIR